jgi:hypothetical protein
MNNPFAIAPVSPEAETEENIGIQFNNAVDRNKSFSAIAATGKDKARIYEDGFAKYVGGTFTNTGKRLLQQNNNNYSKLDPSKLWLDNETQLQALGKFLDIDINSDGFKNVLAKTHQYQDALGRTQHNVASLLKNLFAYRPDKGPRGWPSTEYAGNLNYFGKTPTAAKAAPASTSASVPNAANQNKGIYGEILKAGGPNVRRVNDNIFARYIGGTFTNAGKARLKQNDNDFSKLDPSKLWIDDKEQMGALAKTLGFDSQSKKFQALLPRVVHYTDENGRTQYNVASFSTVVFGKPNGADLKQFNAIFDQFQPADAAKTNTPADTRPRQVGTK